MVQKHLKTSLRNIKMVPLSKYVAVNVDIKFIAFSKLVFHLAGKSTDYGRLMATSQILYGQYHVRDMFGLSLKKLLVEKTTE